MKEKPLLHLVFGGRVADLRTNAFEDTKSLDIVGIFPNYGEAYKAWRGASQSHVDDAYKKYVIVHLHRILEPEKDK